MQNRGADYFLAHRVKILERTELLAALKRGDKYVTLDDGSVGMLPEK